MERGTRRSTTTALLIGFSATWLSVALIGCGGSSSELGGGSPSPSRPPGSIGVAGGQVSSADGYATLTVPASALTTDTVFTINPANSAPSSTRIVGTVFDVEPTGTTFPSDNPAQLTLTYDTLPVGVDASTLRLGTVVNGDWITVTDSPTDTVIDAANQTVTAPIAHLSLYAVLQPPIVPTPSTPPSTNHAPIANAGGPYTGTVNQPLTLYAAGSTDPDGDTLSYTWTFGDASAPSPTTSQTVTHTYSAAGAYTATLTIGDGHGGRTVASATVTIIAPPPVNQPPSANAGGPYSGTAGQAVAFSGASSSDPDGNPLTYGWDFGDATSGVGATPTHAYGTAGTFHVTLTVTDSLGAVATATVDAVIAPPVNHAPTASAGGPYTGTVNQPLTLYAAGSTDPDGDALTYTWTFGDASVPSPTTSQMVTHTYSAANGYTATLTVTDGRGGSASATATVTITAPPPVNQPPSANAGGPYNGTAGQAVAFNGASSSDPDGNPLTYGWDFGDATSGVGATPTHAYGTAGTFHVTLTVTDSLGAAATATVDAVIAPPVNHAPTASAGGPYTGTVNQPLTLYAAGSTDPDGDALTYTWTFGDASVPSPTTSQMVTHTYSAANGYTATLTVTDGRGGSASATATVTITAPPPVNQPPSANAGGPYNGTVGQAVAFDGSASSDPDNDPLTYVWDFGDQTAGTGVTPAHAYGTAGTFHVTLTVTDSLGAAATATVDAVIAAAPPVNHPPTASAGGPYSGTVNQVLTLSAAGSIDPDGDPLSYTWTFGDVLPSSTTASQTVTHTYSSPGVYTAGLIVDDGRGLTATATAAVTITAPPPVNQSPVANAGGPYSGTAGQAVAFNGSSSGDPDGDPLTYVWGFGDLTSGTGVTPAHTYSAAGTFHVTLTVSDGRGGTAIATVDAVITAAPTLNQPPTAGATIPATGLVNLPLTFTGFGSDPDGDPLTFNWNFGDGSAASSTASASHTYTAVGSFTVTLTVSDGRSGFATASGTVGITTPTVPTAVSQQYMIDPRQSFPQHYYRYAITLSGTGVAPLTFRIVTFPTHMDLNLLTGIASMDMVAGVIYQWWNPVYMAWKGVCQSIAPDPSCKATTSSHVDLTLDPPVTGTPKGDVTVNPVNSPVTVIYLPIPCWTWVGSHTDSFSFVVTDANGATSAPATISITINPNVTCHSPSF